MTHQENNLPLLRVRVAEKQYVLHSEEIVRVLRAVAILPADLSKNSLIGWVDIAGELLPVVSLRYVAGLSMRSLRPEDRFILLSSGDRRFILLVDDIQGLVPRESRFDHHLDANNDGASIVRIGDERLRLWTAKELAPEISSHTEGVS